jgi:hypothetical protein
VTDFSEAAEATTRDLRDSPAESVKSETPMIATSTSTQRLARILKSGCCIVIVLAAAPSHAISLPWFNADETESGAAYLEVVEPYIEMHTGPGRGYPVFNVVEQGQNIEILKRKPGWYKIRSKDEKTGWTKASQLAHTLQPTGLPVDLPEVGHGDYLTSHWGVGFKAGQLEGANTFSASAGYRPFSWVGVEVEGGKIYDDSVTSDYYGANILVEPLPNMTLTPFASAGIGKFSFDSRQKVLVEDAGSPTYNSFGGGASLYIGRNFVVRGEYRWYSISTDDGSRGLNAWTIGLNAFF